MRATHEWRSVCALAVLVSGWVWAVPVGASVKGDANCDGWIGAADITAIASQVGLLPADCDRVDVDGDGVVTADDLLDEIEIVFPRFEEFVAQAIDFECLTDWPRVRRFRIANELGHLDFALAVARGEEPLPYPPGTIIQLIPNEAMVKRGDSFDLDNGNWEYFFLDPSSGQTRIVRRGRDEVFSFNPANTCFGCHSAAREVDFICESGNGCVELGLSGELIDQLQAADPRCG